MSEARRVMNALRGLPDEKTSPAAFKSATALPSSTVPMDRRQLTSGARVIYDAGYAAGYLDGLTIQQRRGGYEQGRRDGWRERVEHEYRAWEPMARSIKAAGGPFALSFDELQRRRAQLPEGYVPRPVPTFEECMASWDQPQAVSA